MIFGASSDNATAVLNLLIKGLKVPVSTFTVKKELHEHPDYPSLLALSDCLTSWKIPNEAIKFDKSDFDFDRLPIPFVAHIENEGDQFILVDEIIGDSVKFSNEKKSNGQFSKDEFLTLWNGIVLLAEKNIDSGEENYFNNVINGFFNRSRSPFLIFALIIASIYAIDFNDGAKFWVNILLGLKTAGISVSVLLLIHSFNSQNPFIQNLCGFGKDNDCNAILKSQAANVTSWLSWSEVGMFYFGGSFLCLLTIPESAPILAGLCLLCLPYTVYSIGYQFRIKNWCVLCCSVQLLLWLEAISFYLSGAFLKISEVNITTSLIIGIMICFLIPIAVWSFIKPFMLKAGHVLPLKQQLKKFKYNSKLFNQLLSLQAHYAVPDELMPIRLGNPNAETVITMVSNPFCSPCAIAHKKLDEWLQLRDDLQLKILFATTNRDNDSRTIVARHVIALTSLQDKKVAVDALNSWYNNPGKSFESWVEKYPIVYNSEITEVMEKQKEWCKMAEIQGTPTILVNGYKLTDPYRLDDIKYLLT